MKFISQRDWFFFLKFKAFINLRSIKVLSINSRRIYPQTGMFQKSTLRKLAFVPASVFIHLLVLIDIHIFSGIVHFMFRNKFSLLLLILAAAVLACTRTVGIETPEVLKFQDTATPVIPPTPTPFPTNTPVPTLIPEVQIEDADRAYFNGDWEVALQEYEAVFWGDAASDDQGELKAAALLGIGRVRTQMGQPEEALKIFNQLLVAYPDASQLGSAHFGAAQAYEALSLYAEAADAYAKYLDARAGLIDSYVLEWRGDALVAAGDALKAIDVYQAAYASSSLGETLPIELKVANAYAALGDPDTALLAYQDIYTRTSNDYTKAQVDLLMGRTYTNLGQMESANAAYLDAVENYPLSYDSYQALITLVETGYPVSEFDRGLIDYFAGQYNLAIGAFDRYLAVSTENAGTAYYYKGLAYLALDNSEAALASWDVLIQSYPEDEYWDDAWDEVAFTQWAYLDQYSEGVDTLLSFVATYPTHQLAPEYLFDAALIAERARELEDAASIWLRIPQEYPSSQRVNRAIFLAGIAYYRSGDYTAALSAFELSLNSTVDLEKIAAAYFWMAKSYQGLGNASNAEIFFSNAANEDPTGYYSERARDILEGRDAFEPPVMYDLAYDGKAERATAEAWLRMTFVVPEGVDISSPGSLLNDLRLVRGTELWNLGLYELARAEFESLRADVSSSPVDSFRLANYLTDLGLYRTAIFAARQVLDSAGMDDAETLQAPIYFNHLRFGSYYKELVLPAAQAYGLHPLFLFSVLRQESLFEGFVRSSAGARGLMQIMPATGESIVANAGWPPGYTSDDLYRPSVSVALGADYLEAQSNYFDGDLYAALAAYNAGPGNTLIWMELADGDPDLFLEIIRFEETRSYIKGIYEVFSIYHRLYDRSP